MPCVPATMHVRQNNVSACMYTIAMISCYICDIRDCQTMLD